jgi:hypothetical protein
MSAPIPLRRDFGASQRRGLAKKTKDGPQARRLLALAAISRMIESGPIPAVHGVVRWWLIDLAQWRMWRAAHVRRMDQFMPTTMPVLGLGSRFTNRDRSSTARRLFADPDS